MGNSWPRSVAAMIVSGLVAGPVNAGGSDAKCPRRLALCVLLLAFPAAADDPAASVHDVPPFGQFRDMVTRIPPGPASASDKRCVIGGAAARKLEEYFAIAVMQAGFPNAAPPPIYMDPPLITPTVAVKPIFTIGITTKVRASDCSKPTCLAAMRADVALGRDMQLVLWSRRWLFWR